MRSTRKDTSEQPEDVAKLHHILLSMGNLFVLEQIVLR